MSLSHVWLFVTPWTVTQWAAVSMGFSKQRYWSGLPFPPWGDLPDLGIEPGSPALPALPLCWATREALIYKHFDFDIYVQFEDVRYEIYSYITFHISGNIASLMLSCSLLSDSLTSWAVAHEAPLFMGYPRQEYWSGLPFPPPGNLPDPGIEWVFSALQADSLPSEPSGKHFTYNELH